MSKKWTNLYSRVMLGFAAILLGVVAFVGGIALLGKANTPNEDPACWDGSRDQFPEGFGTAEEPFLISTASQLAFIADRINNIAPPPFVSNASFQGDKYFELTKDIILSSWPSEIPNAENHWIPIGNNSSNTSLTRFAGHFDGKGHRISGLYIDSPQTDYNALFSYSNGTIKNITLENSYVNGRNYTAGIVGFTTGSITNCHNNALITSNTAPDGVTSYTGGIVAYSEGSVYNCTNNGNIVSGNGGTGIAGVNSSSNGGTGGIGGASGNSLVGGIAGYIVGEINDSTNNAKITGGIGGTGGRGGSGGSGTSNSNGGTTGGAGGSGSAGGESFTGGIVGKGSANNCSNDGVVNGGTGGTGGQGGNGGGGGYGGSNRGGTGGTGGTGGVGGHSYSGGITGDGLVKNSFNYGYIAGGSGGIGGSGGSGGGGGSGYLSGSSGSIGVAGSGGNSFTGGIAGKGIADVCFSGADVKGNQGGTSGLTGLNNANVKVGFSCVGGIIGEGIVTHGKVSSAEILAVDGISATNVGGDNCCGGLAGKGTVNNSQIIDSNIIGGNGFSVTIASGIGGISYTGGVVGQGDTNATVMTGCNITGGNGGDASNGTGGISYTGGIAGEGDATDIVITSSTITGGLGGNATSGVGGKNFTGGVTGSGGAYYCYIEGSVSGGNGGTGTTSGGQSYTGGISGTGDVNFGYTNHVPVLAAKGGNGISGGESFCGGITGQGYVYNSLAAGGSVTGGSGGTATTGSGGSSTTGGISAIGKVYNSLISSLVYGGNGGNGTTGGKSNTGGILGAAGKVYNSFITDNVFGGIGGNNDYTLTFTGSIAGGIGEAEKCYLAESSRINIFERARPTSAQFPENAVDCFNINAARIINLGGGESATLLSLLNNWVDDPIIETPEGIELSQWIAAETPYLAWIDENWGDPFIEYFTIRFVTNGGNAVNPIRVQENANLAALRPVSPTLYGYDFAGWFKDESLTEQFNFQAEPSLTEDITLYAKWTLKQWTVAYNFDGGTHSLTTGKITYGNSYVLVVPTKTNHAFDGWFSIDGAKQYTDDTGKSMEIWNEDIKDSTVNMIAHWTKNGFVIDFVTNTDEDLISAETVDKNTNMANVLKRIPVRKGYTFDGWFKEPELKNEFNFNDESPPTTDITLYAGWTAKTYTIICNLNNGSSDKKTANITWGDTYELFVPKLNNYYFEGWFDKDGRQYTNTSGKSDTFTWDVDINNFNLYAHWKAAEYDMRFDFGDGRPWTTITHPYDQLIPSNKIPTEPTRDFGTFKGWFTPSGVQFDFEIMGMPANGVSLTARWEVDMTKLQLLVSELQGYIDFDGFEKIPYDKFLEALEDATEVVKSVEPQTIEQVKKSYDDLLASAIDLAIADFTGKVIPPDMFRPNTSKAWVFILLGSILFVTAAALAAWYLIKKRTVTGKQEL